MTSHSPIPQDSSERTDPSRVRASGIHLGDATLCSSVEATEPTVTEEYIQSPWAFANEHRRSDVMLRSGRSRCTVTPLVHDMRGVGWAAPEHHGD